MATFVLKNRSYFRSLVPKMIFAKEQFMDGLREIGFFGVEGKANFIWVTHPDVSMRELQRELSENSILVRHFELPQFEKFIRITIPPLEIVDFVLSVIKLKMKKLQF